MRGFRYEPALYVSVLNAALAAAVAYGLPLNSTQTAAVITVATAVLAMVTAVMTRPVEVSALTGAGVTLVTALGAFGLHLTQDQLGTAVALVSILLGLVLRGHVSPAPAAAGDK
jgi:intracellular septation protein A